MDKKLQVLLTACREAAIILIAALEDYLSVEYKHSALAKRQLKVST